MVAEVMDSIAGRKSEPTSVDTGRFLNSIGLNSDMTNEFTAIVKSDLNYAAFLEKGTSRMSARHHFENSLDRKKRKILRDIKEAVK